MFRNMKLGAKLLTVGCLLTLLPLIIVGTVVLYQNRQMLKIATEESTMLAYADLDHMTKDVHAMCAIYDEELKNRLKSSLKMMEELIDKTGGFSQISENVSWSAINQLTKSVSQKDLPKLLLGSQWMGQVSDVHTTVPLVDKIGEFSENTFCAVFQRMNSAGDMIQVATNMLTKDGSRATGSYIPARYSDGNPNPVIQSILAGQSYYGRFQVMDGEYISGFRPIYDASNKIIGAIYVGQSLKDASVLRKAIIDMEVGKTGYVYVLDSKGHYVISDGGKRDGEYIWESRDEDGNLFIQEIISKALSTKQGEITEVRYPWRNPGDPAARMKVARIMYYQPWDWVIGVGSYLEEFYDSPQKIAQMGNRMTAISVGVTVAALLAAVLIWLFTSKTIAGPIVNIADTIKKIASERDLTLEVPVDRKDEVGSMALELNNMISLLRQSFVLVTDSAGSVENHANDVSKRAMANRERAENEEKRSREVQGTVSDMGKTAVEVAGSSDAQSEAAMRSNEKIQELVKAMANIAESTQSQAAEADMATQRVVAMGETGAKVVATAKKQGEEVSQVTLAMNNLAKAVEEMTQTALRSTEHGKQVLEAAQEGAGSVNATVEGMKAIAESSDQISEIISVITEIAEQTNLLALNAAIEAARAGAHGKGFAVVADEVGKLAQRSSEAAKEITQLIKDSTSRVNEGSRLTDQSQLALKKITEGGKVNMQAIEEISKTAHVLDQGIHNVHEMMKNLNSLAQEIETIAGQQGSRREAAQKALSSLVQQSEKIAKLVQEAEGSANAVSEQMEEIVKRTNMMKGLTDIQAGRSKKLVKSSDDSTMAALQTVEGAGQVVGITKELQNLSAALTKQVSQFKVNGREQISSN
ncbi:MAG: Cache 3/Cache 2 fusion domain-containing protein [Desulfobacterales bacterium]